MRMDVVRMVGHIGHKLVFLPKRDDDNVPHSVDTDMLNYLPKIMAVPTLETQIFIFMPKLCMDVWQTLF